MPFWYWAMMRLIIFRGKFRIGAGNQPAVDIENDAADRVNGRSHWIFCCNCCFAGVMVYSLLTPKRATLYSGIFCHHCLSHSVPHRRTSRGRSCRTPSEMRIDLLHRGFRCQPDLTRVVDANGFRVFAFDGLFGEPGECRHPAASPLNLPKVHFFLFHIALDKYWMQSQYTDEIQGAHGANLKFKSLLIWVECLQQNLSPLSTQVQCFYCKVASSPLLAMSITSFGDRFPKAIPRSGAWY